MSSNETSPRWLLLAHQLPSQPSKQRVKVWRRLQAVGAVLLKNSVYVLPNTAESREDFEWLRGEIVADGGEAVVFTADTVDELTTDQVVAAFTAARQEDWHELRERAEALREAREAARGEPGAEGGPEPVGREIRTLRNRAAQIDRIDFFDAPGRDEALAAIEGVAATALSIPGAPDRPVSDHLPEDYRGSRWLTRPRPGIDRTASAWLIRRFIDPDAEFRFADHVSADEDAIPFDMFGVEFGHRGESCTFETLLEVFGLEEPALARIARIVHDLDLRHNTSTDAEAATLGRVVAGMREAIPEDAELLDRGMGIFEALYRSFRRDSGPRDSGFG